MLVMVGVTFVPGSDYSCGRTQPVLQVLLESSLECIVEMFLPTPIIVRRDVSLEVGLVDITNNLVLNKEDAVRKSNP